jgi:hypothetical protein
MKISDLLLESKNSPFIKWFIFSRGKSDKVLNDCKLFFNLLKQHGYNVKESL